VKEDEVGRACGTQGEERKKLCKILVVKPEGKRPFGRQRRRWEDVIRMDIVGDWLGVVEWIQLAQHRGRRRAVVNAVMNLRVLASRSWLVLIQLVQMEMSVSQEQLFFQFAECDVFLAYFPSKEK
jgi:hypothetical protein